MSRRSKTKKRSAARKKTSRSRAIWRGSIDFGLVNIPVRLYSAESSERMSFDLLDKRDFSRVRYRRVNEKTGREVPWNDIVKGYEYEKDDYVALSDNDFAQANVEATQTIAISDFVDVSEISPVYYDKPYYLEPQKNAQRAYALLRTVLKKTHKVGIARIVVRSRQRLAMLFADETKLILNLLRFSHDLRDASGLDLPKSSAKGAAVSAQEVQLAEQLVETMESKWDPDKYRDDYRDDLMKIIEKKIKAGKTKVVESAPAPKTPARGKVIDIMHLLRQSVKQVDRKEEPSRRRKTG
jgi:DNA end-binding protein Ku